MRGLRATLVVSLLVNVFTFGVIGGGASMLWHGGLRPHGPAGLRPIAAAGALLPREDRRRFHAAMRSVLDQDRDLLRVARVDRALAAEFFVQPGFDPQGVNTALEGARAADFTLRAKLETAAVAFAATLPPTERAQLAAGLEHGGPLRHPHPKPK